MPEQPSPELRKRDLYPFTGMTRRWFVRIERKPQDCWIGVFWKRGYPWAFDMWICVLPMLPVHLGWKAMAAYNTSINQTEREQQ